MNDSKSIMSGTRSRNGSRRRTAPRILPDMSRPSVDWRFVILATLILTCLVTLASVGRPGAPPFAVLHHRETMTWVAWLLLTPAILTAARRFPFGEGTPVRWLGRHFLLGSLFAIASVVVVAAGEQFMGERARAGDAPMSGALVGRLATGLLLYILVAVSYQAVTYHRAARAREAIAARLRADLAEARLTNLEGKLHPHFLFNTLNSIAALMRADARQAEVMLEQLSELLHTTLRTNPTQEVTLEEALHFTEQYLAIERVRFQERLHTTIEASAQARLGRIPPLILQPLIENAIRHGIGPLESGGHIVVTASVEGRTLHMSVEDDGLGIGNAPPNRRGSGLGVQSVRSILSHLYGADQQFHIRPRMPGGTTVTIAVPYRTGQS